MDRWSDQPVLGVEIRNDRLRRQSLLCLGNDRLSFNCWIAGLAATIEALRFRYGNYVVR
jgi:hypothetical protein